MKDIRCDYFSDHYLEGEISKEGWLKLKINESNNKCSCIYLSKDSAIELIKELVDELENIEINGKMPY